jgi:hypothetical protein
MSALVRIPRFALLAVLIGAARVPLFAAEAPAGGVTFGEFTFESAPPSLGVQFGEFEFETPGTVTFGEFEFERPGEVTFGEFEFESPEQTKANAQLQALEKAVGQLLQNHRKSMEAIERSLDQLERDQAAKGDRSGWFVENVAGGNPTVGTVKAQRAAHGTRGAVYTAPAKVPPRSTVIVHVDVPHQGGTLRLPAEVTVLDATGLLEATWTYEENVTFTFNKDTQGPAGASGKNELKEHRLQGSGTLLFVEPPPKNAAEQSTRALISGAGYRSVYRRETSGSAGVAGSGRHYEYSPQAVERSASSLHGTGRPPAPPVSPSLSVEHGWANLKRSSFIDAYQLIDWSASGATPEIEATHFVGGISYRLKQDRRARWYWDNTPWEDTSTRRMSLHPFPPTGSWGDQPKSAVMLRVLRAGGLQRLRSRSKTGRGRSTTASPASRPVRKATWEFSLTLADP